MRYEFYDRAEYKQKQAEITRKHWKAGIFNFIIKPLQERICKNSECSDSFLTKPGDKRVFCSKSCAASFNNKRRVRVTVARTCIFCLGLRKRTSTKFCSNKCQNDFEYKEYIRKWRGGFKSGVIGITTKTLSGHLRRYLLDKYKYKCSICFWDKIHPITGHAPLEIDHIDGNSENNAESNLRILCPNCHSLTSSFRNLNKGKGRSWRLIYIDQNKPI